MAVLALWEVRQVRAQQPAASAQPVPSAAPARPAAPRPTPLTVVGGSISPATAEKVEKYLEATKGERLSAELRARGATQEAIDFWTTSDPDDGRVDWWNR